jgi:predicted nucleic acid-binding protein
MKPKLYVETSIVSYLTARASRDVVINANQQLAQEWWENRHKFDLFISELVINEAGKGDLQMAEKRLDLIRDVPLIDFNDEAKDLAKEILRQNVLPPKAALDVFHIAATAVHEIDFLLTLNCKHIANAFIFRRIEKICVKFGYEPSIVCTPQEILEKENEIYD